MKKYISYILTAAIAAAIIFMTRFHIGMNNATTIGAVLVLVLFAVMFELKGLDAKGMASVATLSAIGGVVRVPFAGIPHK
jgi:energy-coupling factor transport system substrate-specific component